mgnify:CR=1 FL=1
MGKIYIDRIIIVIHGSKPKFKIRFVIKQVKTCSYGVYFSTRRKEWVVNISINGEKKIIVYYKEEKNSIKAYKIALKLKDIT